MSTFDEQIWSRCSIALTCPAGHISSANRAGKDGARVGINVTAHQEKEKNKETTTGKKRAGEKENSRPILRKLRAALLRSFRGQHCEKIKGSARGNWAPREVQPAISTQPKRGGGPHHHVEAAVDCCSVAPVR